MVSFPNFFMPAEDMGLAQLFWAFVSYGYVLFVSSNMISDGSELLLLIPSLAGLVGSIVLPILGAVPDGMMVLFSGMNPDVNKAQEQVAVGVGALAGSTIMLLTLPWFLAVTAGRVDINDDGTCNYKAPANERLTESPGSKGVQFQKAIKENALFMILSSMIYFVILIPALTMDGMNPKKEFKTEATYEKEFAAIGAVLCLLAFMLYLFLQYRASQKGAVQAADRKIAGIAINLGVYGLAFYIEEFRKILATAEAADGKGDLEAPLSSKPVDALLKQLPATMQSALKEVFNSYAKGDGLIDRGEFEDIFCDLRMNPPQAWLDGKFAEYDRDKSNFIDFKEFLKCFMGLVQEDDTIWSGNPPDKQRRKIPVKNTLNSTVDTAVEDDEDADEEEEVPEEWADLEPAVQKRKILMRSCRLMGLGTLLVLMFSDPMVDVLSGIGSKTGIPAFYISFVLAPLASNASELVAAYSYALKKTSKTITISMSTLEGAACMNNTFCLGIFFALIYKQGLAWRFTAETIVIVGAQVVIGAIAYLKEVQTVKLAGVILSLYPASLVFVSFLENKLHLD